MSCNLCRKDHFVDLALRFLNVWNVAQACSVLVEERTAGPSTAFPCVFETLPSHRFVTDARCLA